MKALFLLNTIRYLLLASGPGICPAGYLRSTRGLADPLSLSSSVLAALFCSSVPPLPLLQSLYQVSSLLFSRPF